MKHFISVSHILLATKCWNMLLCICISFLFGRKWNYFVNSPSVTYAHPLLTIDWRKFWHSKGSSKCAIYWRMLFSHTLILYKLCMCSTWTIYDCIKLNANELSWAGAHWEHWHLRHETTSSTPLVPSPELSSLHISWASLVHAGGNHVTASFSRFRSKS